MSQAERGLFLVRFSITCAISKPTIHKPQINGFHLSPPTQYVFAASFYVYICNKTVFHKIWWDLYRFIDKASKSENFDRDGGNGVFHWFLWFALRRGSRFSSLCMCSGFVLCCIISIWASTSPLMDLRLSGLRAHLWSTFLFFSHMAVTCVRGTDSHYFFFYIIILGLLWPNQKVFLFFWLNYKFYPITTSSF